ncbi:GNAT family N-acetyltransferase [Isoptericola dokdonensis]|jgi:RimJ/RimL family protein N-acetyltransferase|uniref:Lysine N-acyltransferase MbtK n=1 Tax=Isoptericola dokdonensis DS-3 TaxID=1300344 RepID=A0A161IDC3_9MICO|nr:GNAT family N-acetyltransferase [Isoptericola dokdonensis]ANC31217.1 Siderophore biosynthesis protein domain protein [Isoptericola dokdonensis DS-3]
MTDRLLEGERGAEVWRSDVGSGLTAHVLDPVADLDVLHGWVTRPHAGFWGLDGLTRDELRETYEFVESLPTHRAYLVRADGEPVALAQLYHPEDDPVAAAYDARPGDLGVHFFRGSEAVPWTVLGPAMLAFAFAPPAVERLVAEPDARHRAAVARIAASGFELAGEISFDSAYGRKDAVLAFCSRERAEQIFSAAVVR